MIQSTTSGRDTSSDPKVGKRSAHASRPAITSAPPLAVASAMLLVVMWAAFRSRHLKRVPPGSTTIQLRIDLNSATVEELCLVEGIGPTTAARIIENREMDGAFDSLSDVVRVRGVGEQTLSKIAEICVVENSVGKSSPPISSISSDDGDGSNFGGDDWRKRYTTAKPPL